MPTRLSSYRPEQQRGAAGEKAPTVGDTEHAGNQPGDQVEIAQPDRRVGVDPDRVDPATNTYVPATAPNKRSVVLIRASSGTAASTRT